MHFRFARAKRQANADEVSQFLKNSFRLVIDFHCVDGLYQFFKDFLCEDVLGFEDSFYFFNNINCSRDVLFVIVFEPFDQFTVKCVVLGSNFSSLLFGNLTIVLNWIQSVLANHCVIPTPDR